MSNGKVLYNPHKSIRQNIIHLNYVFSLKVKSLTLIKCIFGAATTNLGDMVNTNQHSKVNI